MWSAIWVRASYLVELYVRAKDAVKHCLFFVRCSLRLLSPHRDDASVSEMASQIFRLTQSPESGHAPSTVAALGIRDSIALTPYVLQTPPSVHTESYRHSTVCV